MPVRAVDDKPSDTLVVVSGEGFWTGSSTLPHLHHIHRLLGRSAARPLDNGRRGRGRGRRRPSRARDAARRRRVPEDRRRSDAHRRRGRGDGDGAGPDPGDPVAEAARARARRPPGDGARPPRGAVHRVAGGVGRGGCRRPDAARRAAAAMARSEPRRVRVAASTSSASGSSPTTSCPPTWSRATAGSPRPRSGRGHRCSSTATCRSPTSSSTVTRSPASSTGPRRARATRSSTSPPSRSPTRSTSATSSPATAPTSTATSSARGGRCDACCNVRWLVEHGFGPLEEMPEVAVLRIRAVTRRSVLPRPRAIDLERGPVGHR